MSALTQYVVLDVQPVLVIDGKEFAGSEDNETYIS